MLTNQNVITVLLADDHPSTRVGLRAILHSTPDIQVVGEAQDGFEVEKMVAELHPISLYLILLCQD